MFVLAYEQQDLVILGIMKAQFIRIDVEENMADLELCCEKLLLFSIRLRRWYGLKESALHYIAMLLFPSRSFVAIYHQIKNQRCPISNNSLSG